MIFISFKHRFRPIQNCLFPLRSASGNIPRRFTLTHLLPWTVGFQVCLIDEINSVNVAQTIPKTLIWIMRSTNCIDIVLFHKLNIPKHIFLLNRTTSSHIKFMPVHTFKYNSFSIDMHYFVNHLKCSESNQFRNCFDQISFLIFHIQI